MSTLFQLHTDLPHLKQHLQQIFFYAQAGDAILLMGSTVGLIDMVQDYYQQYATETVKAVELANNPVNNLEGNNAHTQSGNDSSAVSWYGLQADIDSLNPILKDNISFDTAEMTIITDEDWASLVSQFDKVVTLSA